MRIYLDTSVPSAYLDERAPERRAFTIAFWETLPRHDPWISDLVIEEIDATADPARREALRSLVDGLPRLDAQAPEVEALADAYLALGALPAVARADALHVAVAVASGVEAVLSWNLKHMVRLRTRRAVNAVNALRGLGAIEILTPPEL